MADRAQAYTLEAFVAALVLLGAVVFALQGTAVTPQSASTASETSQKQLERTGQGVLDDAAADGSLRQAVLYWDRSDGTFHGLEPYESAYKNAALPTAFGAQLNRSFGSRGIAYNVNIQYRTPSGTTATKTLVDSGTPSDDAVRVAEPLTLYDDDVLYTESAGPGNRTLTDASFYAPDSSPDSGVYNVLTVEVVLWSS